MARQRKLTKERKELIGQLLATYQPEDAGDVQTMLKDLLGDMLQGMLEAEQKDDMGYSDMIMPTRKPKIDLMGTAKKQLLHRWG